MSRFRLILFFSLAIFFFSTLAEFFLLYTVLQKDVSRHAQSTFVFLKARITAYLETLNLLPEVPEYLKDLAWLTDELEGQPNLSGVLVSEGKKVLLDTFSEEDFLPEVLERCDQGFRKGNTYFYCGRFEPLPGKHLFLLVGLNLSYEKKVLKEAILLTILIFLAGGLILSAALIYLGRLSRRKEELERRLSASEKFFTLTI